MIQISQGDIIKITGFKNQFLVISKNTFIKSTNMFHVCPVLTGVDDGPVHIKVKPLNSSKTVTAICEQVKLIDPAVRGIAAVDSISYADKMEVSDAIQGLFEYD